MKTHHGYIPEFDTLRALAAFGVMAAHFAPFRSYPWLDHAERALGLIGVDLFFALSGFLITGILLQGKALRDRQSTRTTLRQFYIRRMLRIFPLYYLLVVIFLFVSPSIRSHWAWYATYTVNIGKSIYLDGWFPLNHFWTLAVEEQFYVFWPLVVLLTPISWLLRLCGVLAVASLTARILFATYTDNAVFVTQLTISCLEPLVVGAAFAIYHHRQQRPPYWLIVASVLAAIATPILIIKSFHNIEAMRLWAHSCYGLFFAGVIALIARYSGQRLLAPLRWSPLTYFGKISYGLYVWHLPVIWTVGVNPMANRSWLPAKYNHAADVTALVLISILVATVSWFVFENPINNLKRYFPYRVVRTNTEPLPPVESRQAA